MRTVGWRWGWGVGWGWGTNEMGDQWEQGRKGYAGGLIRWGTNENCVPRVTLGDQWHGRPITVYPGLRRGTNDMGDQWELCTQGCVGGPMTWGTNENRLERVTMGDQWEGGPMRTVYPGLRWGANDMGDQWELYTQVCVRGPMTWGANENRSDRVKLGDQWDGGPMRIAYPELHWGTNEMGDLWELRTQVYIEGSTRWGTSANYMCTQSNVGGPMRWGTNDSCVPRVGGPMRWGTSEMGDHWDGPIMGALMKRVTNDKGNQWVQAM